MKYLITESQIDRVIFKYLNNQAFIQIKRGDNIFFVNSEGDKYAQIKYDKSDGWCYVYWKLVDEISSFFSLEETDTKEVIGRWVENTLHMRVTHTIGTFLKYPFLVENTLHMRVTHTDTYEERQMFLVENTLHMRVTHTNLSNKHWRFLLRIPSI